MQIHKNIGGKFNTNMVIKSLVWNSIGEVLKKEKDIDIFPFLQSISIRGNTIIVKTGNPLINGEIIHFESTLKKTIKKKLEHIGVSFTDFELRYL